ncbi:MAG: alpha/beta hydrolase [Bacilli bacterium]|nr:alpha/beta hydrolase [Bacilli bacterium]
MKKILLLHGWNNLNYTNQTNEKDAWHNRQEFTDMLSKEYEIYKINFPGFCGEKEPDRPWELSDFATYVKKYLDDNNLKVDYILGYSFGGAVATEYNRKYDNNQKLILISPAITRNREKSKKYIKTPSFLKPIRNFLRDIYLIYVVKNKYMITGTRFLKGTYQNIVRVELLDKLKEIEPKNLIIIYGEDDTMVNPKYVIDNIPKELKENVYTIKNGGHNIAKTHPKEIIDILKEKIG